MLNFFNHVEYDGNIFLLFHRIDANKMEKSLRNQNKNKNKRIRLEKDAAAESTSTDNMHVDVVDTPK